jgi:subtilisin-like proprotein convertase family protein
VAAHNLKARYGDLEITLWTPKEKVKAILLGRFNARLETRNLGTVSGRTSETYVGGRSPG